MSEPVGGVWQLRQRFVAVPPDKRVSLLLTMHDGVSQTGDIVCAAQLSAPRLWDS